MSDDGNNGYVDQVRANTRRYIRELLDEQAELRRQLEEARNELLRREREQAQAQRHEERFAEIEQQNANLAALYAASYQLHTPRRAEVLLAIQEIVINLIGSEELAVIGFGADGEARALSHMGVDPIAVSALRTDVGLIGRALGSGAPATRRIDETVEPDGVTACVPLVIAGKPIGMILMFRLLPQKPRLEPFDHELLGLLATHAATALYCSELHERSAAA